MNCVVILYFICLAVTITTSSKTENVRDNKYPIVNALLVKVKEFKWDKDEMACVDDTLEMLYGVRNRTLWATWAWDSMQSPVGVLFGSDHHFGNYDQCVKAPWSNPVFQYCLVDVEIEGAKGSREFGPYDDSHEYLKSVTKYGRSLKKQTFGVCLPSTCRPATAAKVYRLLHQLTYLVEGNVTVNPNECQIAGESKPWTMKFIVFWGTIAVLFLTVIAATCYDLLEKRNPRLESITKPFSFKSNWKELLKVNDNEIKVMNGIRFLTAASVVIIHESCITFVAPTFNTMDMDRLVDSWIGQIYLQADVVVDTFVVMSGLLLAKSLWSGPNRNLLISLIKRYLRLIGPFAIMTFYFLTSVYETGCGPFWYRGLSQEVIPCEKYWWKNFLMINNDIRTVCYMVTWYVSCDYQLAVLCTLLFFVYRRNRNIGLAVFFAAGTILTVKYGWTVYANKLSILSFGDATVFKDLRKELFLNKIYFNFESRVAAYLTGFVMGYILVIYKPKDYRKIINKKMSAIIFVSSLATLILVVCIHYLYSLKTYNALEAAIIVSLHRTVWALAICGIIVVAEYGHSNLITEFLGMPMFGPLSKLSYGIYLTHMVFVQRHLSSIRSPIKYDLLNITIHSLGIINLSCAASFIMHIIIEAPLIKISNELFKEKKENVTKNKLEVENHKAQNGNAKSKDL